MVQEVHPDIIRYRAEDELALFYHADPGALLTLPPFEGDCGLDLATHEPAVVYEGHSADIPCGIRIALPPSTFGLICARSSTWTRYGLLVVPGIIDEGFRGELFTMVYRPPRYTHSARDTTHRTHSDIPAGTRLAQLIVLPNLLSKVVVSSVPRPASLPPGKRDQHGFGSSGS